MAAQPRAGLATTSFLKLTASGLNDSRVRWLSSTIDKYIMDQFAVVQDFHTLVTRLGFSSEVPRHLKPRLGPSYSLVLALPPGLDTRLPDGLILILIWLN